MICSVLLVLYAEADHRQRRQRTVDTHPNVIKESDFDTAQKILKSRVQSQDRGFFQRNGHLVVGSILCILGMGTLMDAHQYQEALSTRRMVVQQIVQNQEGQTISLESLDGRCRYQGRASLDQQGWKLTMVSGGCTKAPGVDPVQLFPWSKHLTIPPALNALPDPDWFASPLHQGDVLDLWVRHNI